MFDHVACNIPESWFPARICIFVDNEAVIRMIIKDRSPNLRHVSQTYRVDLDWLFERTKNNWQTYWPRGRSLEVSDAVVRRSYTTWIECWPQLFRIVLTCSFFERLPSGCGTPTDLSETSEVGCEKRSRNVLFNGKRSVWETQRKNKLGPQQELQMTPLALGDTQQNPTPIGKKFCVKKQSWKGQATQKQN